MLLTIDKFYAGFLNIMPNAIFQFIQAISNLFL
jgi:hypothetical protein